MTSAEDRLLVVGSINQDRILMVNEFPRPGETVLARSATSSPGGKGANQAVAAARLGASVAMIGAVGDDAEGHHLVRRLRAEGIDTSFVEVAREASSGAACVVVTDTGENTIVVHQGANATLAPDHVSAAVSAFTGQATLMVLQAELSPEAIRAGATAATRSGMRLVLNLAPYRPTPRELLAMADPLIVNESEAHGVLGRALSSDPIACLRDIGDLAGLARSVVVTVGGRGAYWARADGVGFTPAPPVTHVIDTTGAGDALVGAVAVGLLEGRDLSSAVELGVRCGSYAVRSVGAQPSYPTRSEVGIG